MFGRHPQLTTLSLFLVTVVLMLSCCETAMAEMRIFELQYRSAAELIEPVQTLLSDQARVAAYRNSLTVKATSNELDEIAQLIDILDQPQRMLRILVDQGRVEDSSTRELGGSGRIESGTTTIDLGRHSQVPREGGTVVYRSGDSELKLFGQEAVRHESRVVNQFVAVMEGQEARISVGRSVPYTSRMRSLCGHHSGCVETVQYQNVDTGFIVLPEIYGDLVQLKISPFMAFLDPKKPRQIVFQESSTKVRVPLGQWYDLAGHVEEQDEVSREILGRGDRSSKIDGTIRLKVELQ